MQIVHLKIENFRGIKHFENYFNQNLICFVGRGDSGKSTILEAISYVLCGATNIDIRETDFYNCDTSLKICIELSVKDLPKEMLVDSKWGLYIRGFKNNEIIDDITTLGSENYEKVVTIKFEVDDTLEAKWFLKGKPNQEDKSLSWGDREKIKAFKVADYNDKHFSWIKGSPLYKCFKENHVEIIKKELLDAAKEIRKSVQRIELENIDAVKEDICQKAKEIGISLSELKTSIDLSNLLIKEGYFCFHDDNNIPMKQKGKGTKRLLSIAIQLLLLQTGGIILIDEIEQGLEPDRIKNLVRTLKESGDGQIFITTHSSSVVTELPCEDVFMLSVKNEGTKLTTFTSEKQRIVRKFPEAWYAKKVILCEGKTEVGFCRSIDKFMMKEKDNSFSNYDTVYVNADGDGKIVDDAKNIVRSGLKLLVLCDNDDDKKRKEREELKTEGITIVECDENYCFEQ